MAVPYVLHAQTDTTVDEVLSVLANAPGVTRTDRKLSGAGLTGVGMYPEDASTQESVRTLFGFTPRIAVWMIPDKFESFQAGLDTIAGILDTWLRKERGDVVLSFDDDLVVAIRRNGAVTLNKSSSFWSKERLNKIREGFIVGDVPSI